MDSNYHEQIEPAFRSLVKAKLGGEPLVTCRSNGDEFLFTVTPQHGSTQAVMDLFDGRYGFDVRVLPQAFEIVVPDTFDTLTRLETELCAHRYRDNPQLVVRDVRYENQEHVISTGRWQ